MQGPKPSKPRTVLLKPFYRPVANGGLVGFAEDALGFRLNSSPALHAVLGETISP